jgi:hypothetical protein
VSCSDLSSLAVTDWLLIKHERLSLLVSLIPLSTSLAFGTRPEPELSGFAGLVLQHRPSGVSADRLRLLSTYDLITHPGFAVRQAPHHRHTSAA